MLIKCTNGYHYNWWPDGNCDEKPVGSFDLFEDSKHPDEPLSLWSFGIREEENRGKGYGQQMLREAIAMAGNRDIELYVIKCNDPAIHIYTKAGFKVVGNYHLGDYAWRMVRKAEEADANNRTMCCA